MDHKPQMWCDDFDPDCPICPPMCFECGVPYPCPAVLVELVPDER